MLPPGSKIDDRIDRDEPPGKSLGEIAPDSDAYESRGLVAGGKYLHFGTSIYRRTDLRLMSFVNHSGDFDRMLFSPDGERYALVTSTYDHSANRYRVRLRLHDCASGRLLFARAVDDKINDLAFSSDGKRLATVDEGAEMCVWAVP